MNKYVAIVSLIMLFTLKVSLSNCQESSKLATHQLMKKFNLDWVSDFTEGLALASLNKKMIVINEEGKKQFDFPFDYKRLLFHQGFAVVKKKNLFGLIDLQGNLVLDTKFHILSLPRNNVLIATINGKNGLLHIDDESFFPLNADRITATKGGVLYQFQQNKKFGLIDREANIIIPNEYEHINFINDVFVVKSQNNFSLFKSKNDITPINYDNPTLIKIKDKVYIKAKKDGSFGLLDPDQKIVIPFENELINYDVNGYLFVKKKGVYEILNENFEKKFPDKYSEVLLLGSKKYLLENEAGKYLLNTYDGTTKKVNIELINKFKQDNIIFKDNGLFGIVDTNLTIIIPAKYKKISFVKEYLRVQTQEGFNYITYQDKSLLKNDYKDLDVWIRDGIITAKKNGKWGLIDINDTELASFEFDRIKSLRRTPFFQVNKANKSGIINHYGEEILGCAYDKIKEHYGNLILSKDMKYGLMDAQGVMKLPLEYQYINSLGMAQGGNHPQLLRIKKNNLYGIYNAKENNEINFEYEDIGPVRYKTMVVKKNSNFGLIDIDGNTILPFEYQMMEDNGFSNFIFASNQKGMCGLLLRDGTVAVPFEYDYISHYQYNPIAVKKDGLWGYVDQKGKAVTPIQFDQVKGFRSEHSMVSKDKLFGMLDRKGKVIIPIIYEKITPNGEMFNVHKDGRVGLCNVEGQLVSEAIYDCIYPSTHGNVVVQLNEKQGVIKQDGKTILPIVFDEIKRESGKKTERDFNRTSVTSGPTKFYKVSYKEYKFRVDNEGQCIENCPPKKIMKEIFKN